MKGKAAFLKHQKGVRLGPISMIQAKCFECMGRYADGTVDCNIPECSLYPVMPYRNNKDMTRIFHKVITEGQRKKKADTLARTLLKKKEEKEGLNNQDLREIPT